MHSLKIHVLQNNSVADTLMSISLFAYFQGSKVSVTSRRSHPSGDQASIKSDGQKQGRPPRINFFRLVVATRAWQRLAQSSRSRQQQIPKVVPTLENTYKTEPDDGKHFAINKVESLLKETLEHRLNNVSYSSDTCRPLTTDLTADIKSKVKALEFPRYKLVCNVIITENKAQGMEIASRCVWNQSTDNFASYTYTNASLIAIANVYGVYFE